MVSKILIIAALASLAVAVQGVSFSSLHNVDVVPQKESRIIEIPSLGALILKVAKVVFFIVKSVWSVAGLKLGAIALVANLIIWGIKNSIFVILGAAGMLGFCKLTGKCSLDHLPKPVLEIGDSLYYAARQLQNGADLYEGNEVY